LGRVAEAALAAFSGLAQKLLGKVLLNHLPAVALQDAIIRNDFSDPVFGQFPFEKCDENVGRHDVQLHTSASEKLNLLADCAMFSECLGSARPAACRLDWL
jgi:hypothetical protein